MIAPRKTPEPELDQYQNLMNNTVLTNKLKAYFQYIIPQHFLSSLMYKLTRSEIPPIKAALIRGIARLYKIDVEQAQETDLSRYHSFNHFFTRALKPEYRPIDLTEHAVISPVDGTVSQVGLITAGKILQAKKHRFEVQTLLAHDESAKHFLNGNFTTLYLSPRDYHRIHAPFTGKLLRMIYVPGKLFSVSPATTEEVSGLFARNERVVCIFDTEYGICAVVLVGAIFVSSMETVWAGDITPNELNKVTSWDYSSNDYFIYKGDELGRFNMGSTVILLFPGNQISWEEKLNPGQPVKMGEKIAVKMKN